MRFFVSTLLLVFAAKSAVSQVTAQGVGGKWVAWGAFALEQKLNSRFTNRNIIGYSRHSPLESNDILRQFGVFTVREQLTMKLSDIFKLSGAGMFARRGYADSGHPPYIDELRLYSAFTHSFNVRKIKFSQYIRTDYRWFYEPGLHPTGEPFEFRLRYRIKAGIPITNTVSCIGMTEFLAATDESVENGEMHFSSFSFTENRTSLFIRKALAGKSMFLDLGIMSQEWRDENIQGFRHTWLLQMDVVLVNPFQG